VYRFVTDWTFHATPDEVWDELMRAEEWPTWWKGVLSVDLIEPGDSDGVGAYRRMVWRSRLPYMLRFNSRTVAIDRPRCAEGVADGDLNGVGRWTLTPTATGTHVRYEWNVETTKAWMRWFAPVARPFFAWNHDVIMRWGYEGLSKRLARRATTR